MVSFSNVASLLLLAGLTFCFFMHVRLEVNVESNIASYMENARF